MASEQLQKIAQDDAMRIAIYAREKAETDRLAEIARATNLGRQEGRQEGKHEMIRGLINKGLALDMIADVAGMSTDEIKKIMNNQ